MTWSLVHKFYFSIIDMGQCIWCKLNWIFCGATKNLNIVSIVESFNKNSLFLGNCLAQEKVNQYAILSHTNLQTKTNFYCVQSLLLITLQCTVGGSLYGDNTLNVEITLWMGECMHTWLLYVFTMYTLRHLPLVITRRNGPEGFF